MKETWAARDNKRPWWRSWAGLIGLLGGLFTVLMLTGVLPGPPPSIGCP